VQALIVEVGAADAERSRRDATTYPHPERLGRLVTAPQRKASGRRVGMRRLRQPPGHNATGRLKRTVATVVKIVRAARIVRHQLPSRA
jgi:hypothetical protein